MSNIVIDIAAQFTGKKAFDKSEQAVNKLGKTLKKAVIGVGLTKVLTDSVKAFAADEKAAANLANTLQNLGLATFTASVESMIDKIQLATGVMDDELRPAFQTLVTSTGSAIKAQELLKLALDVSAGSGKDLASVSSDIAKVIAGNTKGLGKYSLGLSKAEIAILSTDDALKILMGTFSGASEKASKTFGASMLRIKAAVESAKESLGAGLVDGLMTATGSANIEELQQNILDFGVSAGNTFRKLGEIVRENLGLLKTLGVTFAAIWTAAKVAAGIEAIIILITRLNKAYKYLRATSVGAAIAQMAVLNPVGALAWGATLVAAITVAVRSLDLLTDKFNGASDAADQLAKPRIYGGIYADKYLKEKAAFEKKQIADQLARDKAAAAAKIKADKLAAANKAKLAKAAALFDLSKIQIAAALKGKISEEEKTRLLLMQAIENEQGDKAEALAKKLEEIQAKNAKIAADLLAIGATKDPFSTWAGSLSLALLALGKLGKGIADVPGLIPGVNFNPAQNADRNYDLKVGAVTDFITEVTGNGDVGGAGGGTSIFADDDTIDVILVLVENAAADAAAAAEAAALSVAETGVIVTALSDAVLNGTPAGMATGSSSMFNPYGTTPGSSSGYGTQAPTIIVNNNGSVIMQDEFIDVVNDAVLASQRFGYGRTPAGAIL